MLTKEIANEIVRETSLRIHRNINIMDMDGCIIAAKDQSRIGLIHEGALEVLRSGEELTIHATVDNEWKVAQPGINLPIIFQQETIGVIGITGDPYEVKDLGELVKMTTELMIKQEFIASQLEWRQRTQDMIIGELLAKNPSYNDVQRRANLLNIALQSPFLTVMIQMKKRSILNQAFIQMLEDLIGRDHCIMSFTHINRLVIMLFHVDEAKRANTIHSIYETLMCTDTMFRIAYSMPFQEITKFNQSYLDCELTLKISDTTKQVVSFTDIEVKSLIYQLNDKLAARFSGRIFGGQTQNEVYTKTLKAFFSSDLNIQKAADMLYVHRNTLIYRLDKITALTGYDPRKFEDALNLQVALWIIEKQK